MELVSLQTARADVNNPGGILCHNSATGRHNLAVSARRRRGTRSISSDVSPIGITAFEFAMPARLTASDHGTII